MVKGKPGFDPHGGNKAAIRNNDAEPFVQIWRQKETSDAWSAKTKQNRDSLEQSTHVTMGKARLM
jgi:hypothetical protein